MMIDQRNAGASVTPTTNPTYVIDRWRMGLTQSSKYSVQQNAGSVTPPVGFSNYLGVTSLSAYSVLSTDFFTIIQAIEGFNFYDMQWGTANAKTITLSFWVRSSLTGTFGGAVGNNAGDRSYPFSYTISSANTWTQIAITIAGDQSGTWIGASNAGGMWLYLNLGAGSNYSGTAGAWTTGDLRSCTGATSVVGTSGATFYITGVQLEKGSTATSFDYRPYGTELALCQRYFEMSFNQGTAPANGVVSYVKYMSSAITTTGAYGNSPTFAVEKRTSPTMTIYRTDNGGTNGQPAYFSGGTWNNGSSMSASSGTRSFGYNFLGSFTTLSCLYTDFQWTASAEL